MRQFFEKDIHLGILKGGQLGRMLLQPCMNFGIVPHIMDIDQHAPARAYCQNFVIGDTLAFEDIYQFGKDLHALTLEFEHVNLEALKKLQSEGVNVYPRPELIEIVQDKALQKQFYEKNGIPTTAYRLAANRKQVADALHAGGIVQKKRIAGYDGKGVVVLNSHQDLDKAFDEPSILEEKVEIEKEISILVARNAGGQVAIFPPVEMVFHQGAHMLDYLFSPAALSPQQQAEAVVLAKTLAEQFQLVGLLAVEMFVAGDKILVNEISPRPHNSGHHTIEANATSQFEQHIRAIFDLPLGSTDVHSPAVMVNIVGEPGHAGPVIFKGIRPFLEMPGVYVHRYGKRTTRPYRKMGHITVVRPCLDEALKIAEQIKAEVKAISCRE
jgi:5-(carboxyamino)imidazole ribonucleotide synthase